MSKSGAREHLAYLPLYFYMKNHLNYLLIIENGVHMLPNWLITVAVSAVLNCNMTFSCRGVINVLLFAKVMEKW